MNAHSNSNLISRLAASPKFNLSSVVSWLQNLCNNYVYHLANSEEPQVWQKRDRHGEIGWRAYDPVSGRSLVCSSEKEVRIWLEQLHD